VRRLPETPQEPPPIGGAAAEALYDCAPIFPEMENDFPVCRLAKTSGCYNVSDMQ